MPRSRFESSVGVDRNLRDRHSLFRFRPKLNVTVRYAHSTLLGHGIRVGSVA